jgi:hypothetical protein
MEYISTPAVTATGGFALTATHFFSNAKKSKQKRLALSVRPLAEARRSFAPVSIRGHRPPVGFAGTCMRWVRLRRTALRAHPRMNTSTQPPEGRADQKQARRADTRPVCCSHSPVGARLARDDGLTADQCLQNVLNLCGSEPAREGCVSGDRNFGYVLGQQDSSLLPHRFREQARSHS